MKLNELHLQEVETLAELTPVQVQDVKDALEKINDTFWFNSAVIFKHKWHELITVDDDIKTSTRVVDIDKLIPSQPELSKDYVLRKLDQLAKDDIEVVVSGGNFIISDGHHRATALILSGSTKIKVKIVGTLDSEWAQDVIARSKGQNTNDDYDYD